MTDFAGHTLSVVLADQEIRTVINCPHPAVLPDGVELPACRIDPREPHLDHGECLLIEELVNADEQILCMGDDEEVTVGTVPIRGWWNGPNELAIEPIAPLVSTAGGVAEVRVFSGPHCPCADPEARADAVFQPVRDEIAQDVVAMLKPPTAAATAQVIRYLADRLSITIEREDIQHPTALAADLAAALHHIGVALVRCPGVGDLMGGVRDRAVALAKEAQELLDSEEEVS